MHADSDGQKRETGVSDSSLARVFFGGGGGVPKTEVTNGPSRTHDEHGHFV
jgi:hypothetical protein